MGKTIYQMLIYIIISQMQILDLKIIKSQLIILELLTLYTKNILELIRINQRKYA